MNALTIENTTERVLISIDKTLINTEALTNIIRFCFASNGDVGNKLN